MHHMNITLYLPGKNAHAILPTSEALKLLLFMTKALSFKRSREPRVKKHGCYLSNHQTNYEFEPSFLCRKLYLKFITMLHVGFISFTNLLAFLPVECLPLTSVHLSIHLQLLFHPSTSTSKEFHSAFLCKQNKHRLTGQKHQKTGQNQGGRTRLSKALHPIKAPSSISIKTRNRNKHIDLQCWSLNQGC